MTTAVALNTIGHFRQLVTSVVGQRCSAPAIGYLPDDVADLPAYVIGRPSLRESSQTAVMTVSADVTLLGRRISDEDSQRQLDALADDLFNALGGTRSLRVEGTHLRITSMLPGTVIVAGAEMPAYIATVSTETVSC